MPWAVAISLSFGLFAATSCGSSTTRADDSETVSVDVGVHCSDVGTARVCWDTACEKGVCLVERNTPEAPALTPMGYRCAGSGGARSCVDRSLLAGRFFCRDGVCEQWGPRTPDTREVSCSEIAGVVRCLVEGDAASAVVGSERAPGWFCGPRRGPTERGEICVDFSADYPDGDPLAWDCHYEAEPALRRVCKKAQSFARVLAACHASAPCVDGAVCVAGRCLPRAPEIGCYVDGDCDAGPCRFGTCLEAAP
jgi:hypothetical protein